MIELCTGTLPWKGSNRKEAERIKTNCSEKTLLKVKTLVTLALLASTLVTLVSLASTLASQGSPRAFIVMYRELAKCKYETLPAYNIMKAAIAKEIKKHNVRT